MSRAQSASKDIIYGPMAAQLLKSSCPQIEWVLTKYFPCTPIKAGLHRGTPISDNYQLS